LPSTRYGHTIHGEHCSHEPLVAIILAYKSGTVVHALYMLIVSPVCIEPVPVLCAMLFIDPFVKCVSFLRVRYV
jgi:hypothetical protein